MTRKRLLSPLYTVFSTIILCALFTPFSAIGKEGMWMPPKLRDQEREMKEAGLQIAIDRIYNEKGTGLNNAIVLFGKGCTGEIISPKGLILTNHHCGYGSAQSLSSPEKDYFANGFWAKNMQDELPVKGLTVTFIRKIEDVTSKITAGIADTLRDAVRDSIVDARIKITEKEMAAATGLDVNIKAFFKGNEYWAAISETFRDIRFVGFPPNGIGAFGGDVENWAWPRHTGDFSIFRIYSGADNRPAEYAATNRPYNADQYLNININGYKEGDFSMVYGFPGTTNEYISSFALKHVYEIADPIAIDARTRKLDIWTKHIAADRDIFIKYTSKRAGVANGWKKWQGEVTGLKINDVTTKKETYEKSFQAWARSDRNLPFADSLLPKMQAAAGNADKLIYQDQYIRETVLAIELIQQASLAEKLVKLARLEKHRVSFTDTLTKTIKGQEGFYKNYDAATDKDVFASLMKLYISKCASTLPAYYESEYKDHKKKTDKWAEDVFGRSVFTSQQKLEEWASKATPADTSALINDPAFRLFDAVNKEKETNLAPALTKYKTEMRYLERLYMKAQREHQSTRQFYPDANLTLRVAYGKIQGLDPDGPAKYSYQTTLADAIALDDPSSADFKVPARLKELYEKKDYGRWGVNGVMPLAFTASNHTSGGNSGSPVLNANGELIGTNFDRAYEGTMSDYYFDPNRCRNISVDIRYTLFIIDKFGGAGWLIDEMNIIKN